MRLGWRPALIYTHRWLGIAGSVIFLVWFVSGVVMMYERMPRLNAEERLARIAPLDLTAIRVSPEEASRVAGIIPERLRIGTLADRPVFRFLSAGRWSTVFADSGAPLVALSPDEAVHVVRRFMPEHVATVRYDRRLTRPDQWTIDGGLPDFLPLHRVSIGDAADTQVYVSDRSGEVVMKTTARGRAWGYLGAVLHWTYFTPFRLRPGLWRWSIIYAALIGCVMCLSGLVTGIWRYSVSRRYRLKGTRARSPYAGLMWWHHYAGLSFGLFTFTWALSGALSLTPWGWAPSSSPTRDQVRGVMGGALRLDLCTLPAIRAAADTVRRTFVPKELEILQFRRQPFLLAYRPPALDAARRGDSPDLRAFQSAQLALEHQLVLLARDAGAAFEHFSKAEMMAAAADALPDAPIVDGVWLTDYDAYYYDRHRMRPLPVLRVRYGDPDETWLYLAPAHGAVVMKQERLSRVNRWLYNGLHSLDFPGLYFRRPLWDIVVIGLSFGGIALTVTTMAPAWRRLKRNFRNRGLQGQRR